MQWIELQRTEAKVAIPSDSCVIAPSYQRFPGLWLPPGQSPHRTPLCMTRTIGRLNVTILTWSSISSRCSVSQTWLWSNNAASLWLRYQVYTLCICYAQTVDPDNSWIALPKPWIYSVCNNLSIVAQSVDPRFAQHKVRLHKLKENEIAKRNCDRPHKAVLGIRI